MTVWFTIGHKFSHGENKGIPFLFLCHRRKKCSNIFCLPIFCWPFAKIGVLIFFLLWAMIMSENNSRILFLFRRKKKRQTRTKRDKKCHTLSFFFPFGEICLLLLSPQLVQFSLQKMHRECQSEKNL